MDKGDLDPPVITSLVRKIVDNVEFLTFLLFTSPIFTHSNFHPPNCILYWWQAFNLCHFYPRFFDFHISTLSQSGIYIIKLMFASFKYCHTDTKGGDRRG